MAGPEDLPLDPSAPRAKRAATVAPSAPSFADPAAPGPAPLIAMDIASASLVVSPPSREASVRASADSPGPASTAPKGPNASFLDKKDLVRIAARALGANAQQAGFLQQMGTRELGAVVGSLQDSANTHGVIPESERPAALAAARIALTAVTGNRASETNNPSLRAFDAVATPATSSRLDLSSTANNAGGTALGVTPPVQPATAPIAAKPLERPSVAAPLLAEAPFVLPPLATTLEQGSAKNSLVPTAAGAAPSLTAQTGSSQKANPSPSLNEPFAGNAELAAVAVKALGVGAKDKERKLQQFADMDPAALRTVVDRFSQFTNTNGVIPANKRPDAIANAKDALTTASPQGPESSRILTAFETATTGISSVRNAGPEASAPTKPIEAYKASSGGGRVTLKAEMPVLADGLGVQSTDSANAANRNAQPTAKAPRPDALQSDDGNVGGFKRNPVDGPNSDRKTFVAAQSSGPETGLPRDEHNLIESLPVSRDGKIGTQFTHTPVVGAKTSYIAFEAEPNGPGSTLFNGVPPTIKDRRCGIHAAARKAGRPITGCSGNECSRNWPKSGWNDRAWK